VTSVGVCGSDTHYFEHGRIGRFVVDAPLVLGHEAAGEVAALGPGVTSPTVGQRVSVEPGVPDLTCPQCLAGRYNLCPGMRFFATPPVDGALAEYVVVHAAFAHPVPDVLGDDAAALLEPLSVGIWAARKGGVTAGSRVLITGAGPIGLMAAAVARHVGARYVVITDVSEPRLELARKLGADLALNVSTASISEAQRALGMREGFDIGLEMSGHPGALPEMILNMNHGGRIAMLGLPSQPISVDWAKVVTHMITVKGIYGREMFETWYAMSAMLQSGAELKRAVTAVVTDRYPAADWAEGFARARSGTGGKVVLDWS
jgi:threonine 3-dehydrogenase